MCEPPTQDVPDHGRPAGPGLTPRPHHGLIHRLISGGQIEPFPPADMLDQRQLHRGQSPRRHLSDHTGTLTSMAGGVSELQWQQTTRPARPWAWPSWRRHTGPAWARRHLSTRRSGRPTSASSGGLPGVRRDRGRPGPERAEPGRAAAVAAWLAEADWPPRAHRITSKAATSHSYDRQPLTLPTASVCPVHTRFS